LATLFNIARKDRDNERSSSVSQWEVAMVALPISISPTIAAIDDAVAKAEVRDFDHVVRGSSIGHPCERHLWYRFRWAHEGEKFDGRKLRLFHTGHVEEERLVAYLRLAGVEVQAVDPATGEQWEVV